MTFIIFESKINAINTAQAIEKNLQVHKTEINIEKNSQFF